jgi:hypothetical protein
MAGQQDVDQDVDRGLICLFFFFSVKNFMVGQLNVDRGPGRAESFRGAVLEIEYLVRRENTFYVERTHY